MDNLHPVMRAALAPFAPEPAKSADEQIDNFDESQRWAEYEQDRQQHESEPVA